MKKTILPALVFITYFAGNARSSNTPALLISRNDAITSLVVNANVTVVLVTQPGQQVQIAGDKAVVGEISVSQDNGKLVIDGNRKKNYKRRIYVYVPAMQLQKIWINNAAFVRTLNTLRIPILKVLINGKCKIRLATLGKIDLVENDHYEMSYQVFEKNPVEYTVVKSRE